MYDVYREIFQWNFLNLQNHPANKKSKSKILSIQTAGLMLCRNTDNCNRWADKRDSDGGFSEIYQVFSIIEPFQAMPFPNFKLQSKCIYTKGLKQTAHRAELSTAWETIIDSIRYTQVY